MPLEQVVRPSAVPDLDLLPANKDLAAFPVAVAAAPTAPSGSALGSTRSRAAARTSCSSTRRRRISLVTANVLVAATEVVVPVALTYLALDGCAEIVQSLERMRAEPGRAPALTLVVPTLYRKTQLADEILAKLRARFPRSSRARCSAGR